MEQPKYLINFKETAEVKDIVLVLNSLCMVTHDEDLVKKLKDSNSVILKEIDESKQKLPV